MTILPLEFKFIQKTVYFGLQFYYLVRKFCIQIWNSVSDTKKSVCQISANLEKLGLFRPHCLHLAHGGICLTLPWDLIIEMKTSPMHSHHYQGGILRTTF